MSKQLDYLVHALDLYERDIFEAGIDGGQRTSDAITEMNEYMQDHATEIIEELRAAQQFYRARQI